MAAGRRKVVGMCGQSRDERGGRRAVVPARWSGGRSRHLLSSECCNCDVKKIVHRRVVLREVMENGVLMKGHA